MLLHECCYEYAEGCVSCNLHEDIRIDERMKISALISAEGPWCNQCHSYDYAVSLAYKGSKAETVYTLYPESIEVDSLIQAAYINITQEEISPPIRTVSVACNLDIDQNGNVVGIEVLEWPVGKEQS